MRKRIRFIINPRSGTRNKKHFGEWILSAIDQSIYSPEICITNAKGHATLLSAEAAAMGYEIVVAVGGDGSVNETACGLMGTETALGIIPTGSGNGMARHLGIPVDFQKALKIINQSKIDRIDTLSVNEHFCIGTFGIGFDAHIAHLFSTAGTRGYSTYVKLVLREFYHYPAYQYNLIIDGKSIFRESFLLTFANSSQFGNNAVIAPFADVRDGLIEISVVRKFPAIAAPHLIYRMMNNLLHRSKYFEGMKGKDILVKNSNNLKGHIDGEPVSFQSDIKIRIQPLSLNVVIPS